MVLAAKMDEYGKAGWIAATVLGFWVFWPLGVALLLFLAFSGRIRAWRHEGPGRWYNAPGGAAGGNPGESVRQTARAWGWGCCGSSRRGRFAPSGNAAFDEYRTETLRRLEEEQREFVGTSTGCVRRRTRRSSTSSWPTAAAARPSPRAASPRPPPPDRRPPPPTPSHKGRGLWCSTPPPLAGGGRGRGQRVGRSISRSGR